jgi:purine-nucleoside phosphorylase
MGVGVVGISCITNMAAGVQKQPLSHKEVMETTSRVKDQFVRLLGALVAALGGGRSGDTLMDEKKKTPAGRKASAPPARKRVRS